MSDRAENLSVRYRKAKEAILLGGSRGAYRLCARRRNRPQFCFPTLADPGDEVLIQPPVYSHFVTDPVVRGRSVTEVPLVKKTDTYEIDFDAFEDAITPGTKIFVCATPTILSAGC